MQGSPRIDELRQKFHENPRRYFAPLANEYRKAGDPEQAIAICRAHLAQQPGHMSGHVVYGQALYDARRPDEARSVFEKALSLDPENSIVLRQLGDIARERGDSAEARHWYSKALDLEPQDSQLVAYVSELAEPTVEPAAEGTPVEPAAESVEGTPVEPAAESVAEGTPVEPAAESAAEGTPAVKDTEEAASAGSVAANRSDAQGDGAEVYDEQAPPPEEVSWRKTPRPEESPFVTKTMADLYARQGYDAAALDVYRQLAIRHPEDSSIRDRIAELTGEGAPSESGSESAPRAEAPSERQPVEDSPSEPEPQIASSAPDSEPETTDPFEFIELSDAPLFAPSSEDLNLEGEAVSPFESGKHFTEAELASGDVWDSDAWGAGFSPDDSVNPEFDRADAGAISDEVRPDELPTSSAQHVEELPEERIEEVEANVRDEIEEDKREGVPQGIGDEQAFVAYAPEAPPDAELAHFTPRSPTVREFFATLGARRGPSADAVSTSAAQEDLPLANDAFSHLFSDSPATEEDTRAAFALSGALSSADHSPGPHTVQTSPPHPSPAVTTPAQESEEDIRRFREWLDGLAES